MTAASSTADVKPSNVLIGEGGQVVLGDFGIARMAEASLSVSGGSPHWNDRHYMSPEQVQGEPISPASDQYSLAIMAYEMLTGRRPFEAETPLAVALAHLHRPLPPPRTARSPRVSRGASSRRLFKRSRSTPMIAIGASPHCVAALAESRAATNSPPVGVASPTADRLPNVNELQEESQAQAPDQPSAGPTPIIRRRSESLRSVLPRRSWPHPARLRRPRASGIWVLGALIVLVLFGFAFYLFFRFAGLIR